MGAAQRVDGGAAKFAYQVLDLRGVLLSVAGADRDYA